VRNEIRIIKNFLTILKEDSH